MDAITKHHYDNVRNNTIVRNDDGSISTVKTIIMGDGEREYLIPTLWDGEILSDQEAFDRAMSSGIDWPSMPVGEGAVARLEEVDKLIHEGFSADTTPQEAEDIILRGADFPNRDLVGSIMSPLPQERPEITLSPTDIEKMERVIWGEARGETVEGRDAIRGVILNRLASGRFGNTIDEVLTADQFNTIKDHGGGDIYGIPVPREDLDSQIAEAADYIMLGEDVTGGRSFYQVEDAPGAYAGRDPMKIGRHTFYKGLVGEEPVYDVNFSHNIRLINDDEYDVADSGYALGGLVDARKGIATEEGKDMANKKFQMDNKKADKDGDGKLSAYEKVAGEAVQKAEADDPEQDEKYGMCMGGMMMPEEEMDPVSGNPIPLGSTAANVRDDIEIYVSEGEYVLPADVVKWHGLKHIMEMQDEAKMGLMGMFAEGLIQEVAMEQEEEISEVEETEEEDIPSEDMDVEVAAVEVDDMMDEEEETEELYPEESVLPAMIKKQKYAFIA